MIVFLSGPLLDQPDHHKPAFDAAQERLEAIGHIVINPAPPRHRPRLELDNLRAPLHRRPHPSRRDLPTRRLAHLARGAPREPHRARARTQARRTRGHVMSTRSGWCNGHVPIHEDCPRNFANALTPDCGCPCHNEEKP